MARFFRYKAPTRQQLDGTGRGMSDESFFREVNEELRQDKAKALWNRFGPQAIVVALVVLALTCAYVGYRYWQDTRADGSGDRFSAALQLASDGKTDEALAAFEDLEKDGHGAYPVLARMRAATTLADKGDAAGAVAAFDAVSADTGVRPSIRDMARLRAAYILVDSGGYDDVAARAEVLSDDGNALRHAAREAMGLAAWKAGRAVDALKLFDQIVADTTAPRNTRDRATVMAELIRGSGAAS